MGPYGPQPGKGPNPDRAPTRTGPQPGPGPTWANVGPARAHAVRETTSKMNSSLKRKKVPSLTHHVLTYHLAAPDCEATCAPTNVKFPLAYFNIYVLQVFNTLFVSSLVPQLSSLVPQHSHTQTHLSSLVPQLPQFIFHY